jgi:hypothetical protein
VDIAGATGNTLVLGEALVGTTIAVRVRYTDSRGVVESLSSAVTAAVANINDPGRVSIGGSAVQGQTLTGNYSAPPPCSLTPQLLPVKCLP